MQARRIVALLLLLGMTGNAWREALASPAQSSCDTAGRADHHAAHLPPSERISSPVGHLPTVTRDTSGADCPHCRNVTCYSAMPCNGFAYGVVGTPDEDRACDPRPHPPDPAPWHEPSRHYRTPPTPPPVP